MSIILRFYLLLFLTLSLYIIGYLVLNPALGLVFFNWLINLIHSKKVFYNSEEKYEIFKSSTILEKYWKYVRKEAINVMDIDQNVWRNFTNQSEEFWKGWKTFPLRMFGKDNIENQNKCPITREILRDNPEILTAFFSIMEPHKTLPSHYGPFKGILRYHLGLLIPPKEAGNCFISVDNIIYEWKEGEGILFDETYKHFVMNQTDYPRIILFIDVKRPMYSNIMNYINSSLIWIMGNSPYNKI